MTDTLGRLRGAAWLASAALTCALGHARAAGDDAAAFRHHAPITVEQAGAFVRLPLPASAYAMSRQPGLADLRIVDARGQRVPFALLGPRAKEARETETARPADLYPLPAPRPGEKALASPLEVQVVGDRITVRRLERRSGGANTVTATVSRTPPASPGWLFDLGEAPRDEPPATSLRLAWSGPAEFTAAFDLEVSDDLKLWRRAGGGQLLALQSATGHLAQRDAKLPTLGGNEGRGPRFVRLRWADAAQAPQITGAQQVRLLRSRFELDAPTALTLTPVPEPPAPAAAFGVATKPMPAEGALHFDLGGVLPLVDIDLPLPSGHRVAVVRVQGRLRVDEPWRELAPVVFYRIERGDALDRPPPLALATSVRYLRLVPDARSGALPAGAPLAVRAQLASVLFAPQGEAPFRLLAGATGTEPSAAVAPGALPLAALIPALESERAKFGRASLGAWSENETAARAEAWRQRVAASRPALLWAVLLVGVGSLGWIVWRLARAQEPAPTPPPPSSPTAGPQADAERST